jgi:hypothetical protein
MTTSQWVFIEPPRYCRISDWGMPSRLDERRDFAFLSHSGRVWAVVLLNEVGMNPDFFKSQLRWLGDSYRLYLRDTAVLQLRHIAALERSLFEFISLYGENCTTLPDIVPEDNSMGSY